MLIFAINPLQTGQAGPADSLMRICGDLEEMRLRIITDSAPIALHAQHSLAIVGPDHLHRANIEDYGS